MVMSMTNETMRLVPSHLGGRENDMIELCEGGGPHQNARLQERSSKMRCDIEYSLARSIWLLWGRIVILLFVFRVWYGVAKIPSTTSPESKRS